MKKRIIALLIVLVLALTLFAACGSDADTADTTKSPAASATSAATSTAKATATATPTPTPTETPTAEPTKAPVLVNDKYYINYVTDGLVAMYEGKYNTVDGLNTETTTWADLSGNGNDVTDILISDECYFSDKGFFVDTQQVFLPDVILDIINSDSFTIEMQMTDLVSKGTTFNTFLNSDVNDNFAFFTREDNYFEFKSATNSRIKLAGEAEKFDGHIIALTFDLDEGIAVAYCDGEYLGDCVITMPIDAEGKIFIGHPSAQKNYSANWVSLRFYDRALTEDEVKHNASVETAIVIPE